MRELKATEDHMAAALGKQHNEQQKKLQDRLAKRRGRRGELARQECQLKQEQAEEAAQLKRAQAEAAAALTAEARNAAFEEELK